MLKWIERNVYEIGFFVAGWCAFSALDNLGKGHYVWAAINAGLVYMNIKLARK